MQFLVEGDEDGPESPLGVGPQDPETLAVAGGDAHCVTRGAVGVAVVVADRADAGERRVEPRVGDVGQARAGRAARGNGGQTLRDVAAVHLDVQGDHRLYGRGALGVRAAPVGQVVGQGPGLVASPGLKRSDELRRVDQPDLQRDQPK